VFLFADDPIFVAMLLDFHALLTGNRSKLYQTPKTPTESRQRPAQGNYHGKKNLCRKHELPDF
jgi:hypothetical protein